MYKIFDFAIIGGGISGISAVEQISQRLPDSTILLMTSSSFVKVATTRLKLSSHIEELDVQEKSVDDFTAKYPNITVVSAKLDSIHSKLHYLTNSLGQKFGYKKLCLCMGSVPKLVHFDSPFVIGLRDTDSAVYLKQKLAKSKKICIVGNGGIATELIYELKNVNIIWIVRDKYIASTFVDAGAAEFLLNSVGTERNTDKPAATLRYTISSSVASGDRKSDIPGCALGPNWHNNLNLVGGSQSSKTINVEYQSEIIDITEMKPNIDTLEDWPVYVTLSTGKVFGCDFVISATGVTPSVPSLEEGMSFKVGEDGGILVNESMQTSVDDIYAAGDCCTVNWEVAFHWFQMRLWTQARPMGGYAGLCMVTSLSNQEPPLLDFSFELFTHVTRFFGFKVVLLGLFNGQKLDGHYEALIRVTKGVEYLKLIVRKEDGKLHGAVLIGDTDMEETFENLILNQLDISRFGENLLNPDIDIEDYFD